MTDRATKISILQRLIASKKGVPRYDVKITDFSEEKAGVYVTFTVEEDSADIELMTWWHIAMNA